MGGCPSTKEGGSGWIAGCSVEASFSMRMPGSEPKEHSGFKGSGWLEVLPAISYCGIILRVKSP